MATKDVSAANSSAAKACPQPTPDSAPFWNAATNRMLRLQRCTACERVFFYPRTGCPRCGSESVEWFDASGRATLHTYLINQHPAPGYENEGQYAIAVVELEEGPRMMTNVVGVPQTPEHLILDMPLVVDFDPRGDLAVPVFRPAPPEDSP